MGLREKLDRRGWHVLTPASVSYRTRRAANSPFTGRYFYGVGSDNLGAAFTLSGWPNVRGMIYLTPFGCGVDSLVTEFVARRLRAEPQSPPLMVLTIDEHTGEAGFDTRLEAFLDMLTPGGSGKEGAAC